MSWQEFRAHINLLAEEALDADRRGGDREPVFLDPETGLPQGEGWGKLPPARVLKQLPSWPDDADLN